MWRGYAWRLPGGGGFSGKLGGQTASSRVWAFHQRRNVIQTGRIRGGTKERFMTETTPAAGTPGALVDRSAKPRSVSRLIFLALVMIGASVTFFLFKDRLNND
jgi:hypothetical protein